MVILLAWWVQAAAAWAALLTVVWGGIALAARGNDLSDEASEREHNRNQRKMN